MSDALTAISLPSPGAAGGPRESCIRAGDDAEVDRIVRAAESRTIVLFDQRRQVDLESLVARVGDSPPPSAAALALLPLYADDPWPDAWMRMPDLAAWIAPPQGRFALVLTGPIVEAVGGIRAAVDPLWDLVGNAPQKGVAVTIGAPISNVPWSVADPYDLPDLAPGSPSDRQQWALSRVDALVFPFENRPHAVALRAGLRLVHDDLNGSHELSQSVQGQGTPAHGDYWHAIMHRREPDDSNSKYWYRRVGSHPIFSDLAARAAAVLDRVESAEIADWRKRLIPGGAWDPFAFVDFCAHGRRGASAELTGASRCIQWCELLLLLQRTRQDAADG